MKNTKITVIEIIKIIRIEIKNTIRMIPGRVRALSGFSAISAPRKCFAFTRSRAFNKCPQARKNSHLRASTQWLFITRFHALISLLTHNYSMIVATRPDPTVRPPSRIAKVRPCSIAMGWISSMVISTLSPGMHISVPAGSSQTPVTSVVLK